MELKIGVVGLGNCGGQIAALAKEEGFSSVAINVSGDDVNTLEDKVSSIIIGNQMGSGKNREMGKKYGKESIIILTAPALFQQYRKQLPGLFTIFTIACFLPAFQHQRHDSSLRYALRSSNQSSAWRQTIK